MRACQALRSITHVTGCNNATRRARQVTSEWARGCVSNQASDLHPTSVFASIRAPHTPPMSKTSAGGSHTLAPVDRPPWFVNAPPLSPPSPGIRASEGWFPLLSHPASLCADRLIAAQSLSFSFSCSLTWRGQGCAPLLAHKGSNSAPRRTGGSRETRLTCLSSVWILKS